MSIVHPPPVIIPNSNQNLPCSTATPSWMRYLRPHARKALTCEGVSANQLALAEAKARKIVLKNRNNSRRHNKGADSKKVRVGKGKQGFDFETGMWEEVEEAEDSDLVIRMDRRSLEVVREGQWQYNNIEESFWLGRRVKVSSFGFATVTCQGGYKCCCGYTRCNRGIGVTYDDGSTYHCDPDQLHPCETSWFDSPEANEVSGADSSVATSPESYSQSLNSKITLRAISIDGKEYSIPNVSAEMTLRELKQSLARMIGVHSRILRILHDERHLVDDKKSLLEYGVTGPSEHVSFVRCSTDVLFWNLLLRDLLVALSAGETREARYLISAFVECKGGFRLAHALKSAYVSKNVDVARFILENAPAEVLFQALVMKCWRSYSPNGHRNRMSDLAKPSMPLIGLMYFAGDVHTLRLIGSMLNTKWWCCIQSQASLPSDVWTDIERHMNFHRGSLT